MCVCALRGSHGPLWGEPQDRDRSFPSSELYLTKDVGQKKNESAETLLLFPNGSPPDEMDHFFPMERPTLLVPKKNNIEPHTFSWRKPSGYNHTAGAQ